MRRASQEAQECQGETKGNPAISLPEAQVAKTVSYKCHCPQPQAGAAPMALDEADYFRIYPPHSLQVSFRFQDTLCVARTHTNEHTSHIYAHNPIILSSEGILGSFFNRIYGIYTLLEQKARRSVDDVSNYKLLGQ